MNREELNKAVLQWEALVKEDPDNARYLYHLGKVYMQMGAYRDAAEALEKSLSLDPGNPDVQYTLATLYFQLGEVDEAKVLLLKILRKHPDYTDATQLLNKIQREERAAALEKERQRKAAKQLKLIEEATELETHHRESEALAIWLLLIEQSPDNSYYLYRIGKLYAQLDEYAKAERFLKKSLKIDPKNADAKLSLGFVYLRTDRPKSAKELFENVLKEVPDYADAQIGLEQAEAQIELKGKPLLNPLFEQARVFETKAEYQKALAIWLELLKEQPDNAHYRFQIGKLYFRMQEPTLAEDFLKRSLEINPENSDAHLFLGLVYMQTERYEMALEAFEEALAITPDYPDVLLGIERAESAIAAREEASKVKKKRTPWQEEMVECADKYEDAYHYLQAARCWYVLHQSDPEDPYYTFRLGRVTAWMGRKREADYFLSKTLVLDPNYSDATFRLGYLELARNNYKQGQAYFQELLDENPDNTDALRGLIRSLNIQNKNRQAKEVALKRYALDDANYSLDKLYHRILKRTNPWARETMAYGQERETDIITKQTSAQRNTYINIIYGSVPLSENSNLSASFLAGMEREINLVSGSNNLFVPFNITAVNVDWMPYADLSLAGGASVKHGHDTGDPLFPLGEQTRFEPTGSISYQAEDSLYTLSAIVDSILIKEFSTAPQKATFLGRQTYTGYGEWYLFQRRFRFSLTGFLRFYHDITYNRQWSGEIFAESYYPRYNPILTLRYTGRISGYKETEVDYYSFKRQWEHYVTLFYIKNVGLNTQMELAYLHSWQWNRELNQPVSVAVFLDKLFRSTDKVYFEWRQLYRPNIRGVFHSEYYWDSTNYKAWLTKGQLLLIF